MPTVIDSLIVTLGLDPSDFNKGQKAAGSAFLKTRDEAKSAGQDVEKSAKGMADSIDKVTKSALALFGVLVGAHGLTDFLVSVTNTDAMIGRLSKTLGISTANLQQWQAAAARMGGSAEGMTSSVSSANSQLINMRTNGVPLPTGIAQIFSRSGISLEGASGWTTEQYLTKLAQAINADVSTGAFSASAASTLAQQSGFTSDFVNVALAHGGAGLQGYLNSMPVVSDDTIKRLQDLQTTWAKLQQTLTQFFSTLFADFEPALKPFLQDFQNFANILVSSEPTLAAIAKDAASIANSLGGWRVAIEGIVALWAGGKVLGILSAIKGLVGLGGAGTAAATGGAAAAGGAGLLSGIFGSAVGAVGAIGGYLWTQRGSVGHFTPDQMRQLGFSPEFIAQHGGTPSATSGTSGNSWWTPARQAEAYSRLTKEAGLSDAGARALISRWMNVEAPGGPGSVNPSSGAIGIGQWLGARKAGVDGDFGDQLTHAIAELNGSESAAGRALRSAQTAQQGAIGASMYERAEGYNSATGIDNWTAKTLAGMSAVVRSAAMSAHSAVSSMSSHVTLNGPIHIHTQATDATGIAKDLHGAFKRAAKVRPANTGMA